MTATRTAKRWTAAEESRVRSTHSQEAIETHGLAVLIYRTRQGDKKMMAKIDRRDGITRRNGTFKAIW